MIIERKYWERDHRSHLWYQFETAWITWDLAHAEVCSLMFMLHPCTLGYLMSRLQYLQIIGRSSDLLCCLSISAPRSCNNINLPNFENFQLSHSISSFCFQRSPWFKFLHREQLHLSPSANQIGHNMWLSPSEAQTLWNSQLKSLSCDLVPSTTPSIVSAQSTFAQSFILTAFIAARAFQAQGHLSLKPTYFVSSNAPSLKAHWWTEKKHTRNLKSQILLNNKNSLSEIKAIQKLHMIPRYCTKPVMKQQVVSM